MDSNICMHIATQSCPYICMYTYMCARVIVLVTACMRVSGNAHKSYVMCAKPLMSLRLLAHVVLELSHSRIRQRK